MEVLAVSSFTCLSCRRRTAAATNGEPAGVTEQRKAHGGEDGGEDGGEWAPHCLCVACK